MKEIFLIPYAYDYITETSGSGSKARCDALLKKVVLPGDSRNEYNAILTAGFTKDNPGSPTRSVPHSLAHQMAEYIRRERVKYGKTVWAYPFPMAWGTYMETVIAIGCIRRKKTRAHPSEFEIYVSTNLGHMLRVRICWFFLKPKEWQVRFVTANHSFSKKEWFQETVKCVQYLYKFVFRKW